MKKPRKARLFHITKRILKDTPVNNFLVQSGKYPVCTFQQTGFVPDFRRTTVEARQRGGCIARPRLKQSLHAASVSPDPFPVPFDPRGQHPHLTHLNFRHPATHHSFIHSTDSPVDQQNNYTQSNWRNLSNNRGSP